MVNLLLIRHGQSHNNVIEENAMALRAAGADSDEIDTEMLRSHDPELSELGRRQAELTAVAIAERWRGKRCLLIASPMRRSLQTARFLADALRIQRNDFICHGQVYEIGGCYYGQTARPGARGVEIEAEFDAHPIEIPDQGWFSAYSCKETLAEARQRCRRVTHWLRTLLASSDGQYDVIIGVLHGELLHQCLRLWMGVPASGRFGLIHGNCGITEFSWEACRGELMLGLNMQDHIPVDLRSSHQPHQGWWNIVPPLVRIERFQDFSENASLLYAQALEARQQYLFPVDGGCLEDYRLSDKRGIHFIALSNERLAGLVQYDPELNRLRQMLVLPDFRGLGVGYDLVESVVKECEKHNNRELWVHAWSVSRDFYRKAGFISQGEEYESNGIKCQKMKRVLF